MSDERSTFGDVLEKRLNGEEFLELPLKFRRLELSEMPAAALPFEKPWKPVPIFPVLRFETPASIGRAPISRPFDLIVEELPAAEPLIEPRSLGDFPLNAAALLPLPNERIERSAVGV